MRLLAPRVVPTTLALFATGVALLADGPRTSTLVFLHKASFFAWFARWRSTCSGTCSRCPGWPRPTGAATAAASAALSGSGLRVTLLLASLLAGLALALATISAADPWLATQLGG